VPHKIDGKPFGRKQAIIFSRLWSLIEKRLLPLVDRIDCVTVERVAFDILAGKFKARQKVSDEQMARMYWEGPQFGFDSRLAMLRTEFDGRCAYCGQSGLSLQVEHVMPQSSFPYDSYFNVLPACETCNKQKGTQLQRTIHPDAYAAYSAYVGTLKVPHVYHTIKKGLLNHLRMIGENLLNIAGAQAGPRNLARYLATRLKCKIQAASGRHTALYRSIALPEYDKKADPQCNHAIDAIMLACDFPSAPALEGGRFDPREWHRRVVNAAPVLQDGRPVLEVTTDHVWYFEQDTGDGYFKIDLSAFNWNWERRSGCKLDPVGRTATGAPAVRMKAQGLLAKLPGAAGTVLHPRLRSLLESDPDNAKRNLILWLQRSIRLPDGNHPSDLARRRIPEQFQQCPPEAILDKDNEAEIPHLIGVRCLKEGGAAKYNITRKGKPGAFASWPQYREVYVGYRMDGDAPDRSKPIVFYVDQTGAVLKGKGASRRVMIPGRPLGTDWQADIRQLFGKLELVEVHRLSQGCVIERTDGTREVAPENWTTT
jgi:hypothetical protein